MINNMDKITKNHTLFQIQPTFNARNEYEKLADEEGLLYEIIELSTPPALNESGFFSNALEWYKSTGRVNSFHGVFIDINPASGDKLLKGLSRKRMKESCVTALALGAKNIVFHCSCFPFLRGGYLDNWVKESAEFYLELLDEYKLNIYVENSFDVDATPLKELMKAINNNHVRVCLDFGHANYSRLPLEQWFESLGEYIGYLHISNNMGDFDDHLPVLDGNIDWEKVNKLCGELDKNTPITLEVNTIDNIRSALDFFKENHLFGM